MTPTLPLSLSALGGGEGRGEVGDSRALVDTHLTLPRLRRGPLPLPPEGGEGRSHAPGSPAAQAAIARPISGPASSWMKWLPATVISLWLGQARQNSRGAPVRIAPGSALMNSFGTSLWARNSA